MTVVSGVIPAREQSFSKFSRLTMSRATGSQSSLCHLKPAAPGTCPLSYRPGSTLTSTIRTFGSFACCMTQSGDTSASCAAAGAATAMRMADSISFMAGLYGFDRLRDQQRDTAPVRVDRLEQLPLALPQGRVVDAGGVGGFQGAFRTALGMNDGARHVDDRNSAQPADERTVRVEAALPLAAEDRTLHVAQGVADLVDFVTGEPVERLAEVRETFPQARHETGRPHLNVAPGFRSGLGQSFAQEVAIRDRDVEEAEAAIAAPLRARDLVGVRLLDAPVPRVDAFEELAVFLHGGMVLSPPLETPPAPGTAPSMCARSRPEVLAPAGDMECVRAAVEFGADAVYFGLSKFNARARAENFTVESLPELLSFLRLRGVKGYVAFNTLVFADELAEAAGILERVIAAGPDALILQDLGIARLARAISPDIELHASTQTTTTCAEQMPALEELGFSRVILARELTLKDIRRIAAATAMPLEVFVHGALCVAYSGQCLTSEAL